MYLAHFGLSSDPFRLDPNLKYLFVSRGHEEVLAHLVYGLEQGESFVLITGGIGTGKTLALHYLLSQLSAGFHAVFINVTKVDFRELMKMILDDLGAEYDRRCDNADLLRLFRRELLAIRDRREKLVVVVDEAQDLDADTLEGLRLLSNLCQPGEQALQIVLAGQPGLDTLIKQPHLEQLDQRIRIRYKLQHLADDEIGPYIAHRLAVAGLEPSPFSKEAVARIVRESRGIPRLVNQLAAKGMLGAFVEGETRIRSVHLDDDVDEVATGPEPAAPAALADAPARPVAPAASAPPPPPPPRRVSREPAPPMAPRDQAPPPRRAVRGRAPAAAPREEVAPSRVARTPPPAWDAPPPPRRQAPPPAPPPATARPRATSPAPPSAVPTPPAPAVERPAGHPRFSLAEDDTATASAAAPGAPVFSPPPAPPPPPAPGQGRAEPAAADRAAGRRPGLWAVAVWVIVILVVVAMDQWFRSGKDLPFDPGYGFALPGMEVEPARIDTEAGPSDRQPDPGVATVDSVDAAVGSPQGPGEAGAAAADTTGAPPSGSP